MSNDDLILLVIGCWAVVNVPAAIIEAWRYWRG